MTKFGFQSTGREVVEHFKDRVQGKTIVITGATAGGLGAETALSLAHGIPAKIFLLARALSKVQAVIDEIAGLNAGIKTVFVPVELDKIASVRTAASQISGEVDQIDILINNAGIMAVPYNKNDAGIEMQFAVNHIGHFMLTNLLLAKVKNAGKGARIVNLTSKGYMLDSVHFEDPSFSDGKTYDEWSGYGQAKTANILFTRYLAKHLSKDGIVVYAVHPGTIFGTGLANDMDMSLFDKLSDVSMKNNGIPFAIDEAKTKQQGVSTTLVGALDPDLEQATGSYLNDCNVDDVLDYAASDENADKLWALSEKLVGQKFVL